MKCLTQFKHWVLELRETRYRGLAVLHTTQPQRVLSAVASTGLSRSEILCVTPSELRSVLESFCKVISPSRFHEALGSEFKAALMVVRGLLRPNIVAGISETVVSGGFVGLVVPPVDSWNPGGEGSTGVYKSYLLRSFYSAESIFWGNIDYDIVYRVRLPLRAPERVWNPEEYSSRHGVPRKLVESALTREQAELLDFFLDFLRRRGRCLVVLGDRGRGKSGALALIVALLIQRRQVGFIPVTSPSIHGVQSFFRVLRRALERLGTKHWVIRRGGIVVGIAGPWFHVRYHTPDATEPGPFTVIDEAAGLSPARLRYVAKRSPRILMATTVHGYEGTGKTFARILLDSLPEPKAVVELKEPVRYPPGDPLEHWLYETFLLKAEPPTPPEELSNITYTLTPRERLAEDRELLKGLYGILVEAHYRNEPDDLALMLDAPHHKVHALAAYGVPVAVAETAYDGAEVKYEWRLVLDKLTLMCSEASETRGVRVVRIAVHPELQRRGLGSLLLSEIEKWALSEGMDWVAAMFSRQDVLRFWLANGYYVFYVSPRYNVETGERNIGVAKPLSGKGRKIVIKAASSFLRRLLLSSQSTYRTLPPTTLAAILLYQPRLPNTRPPVVLDENQVERLELYLEGRLDFESASDAVYAALVNVIAEKGGRLEGLEESEAVAVAARVLQGRGRGEVAALLGYKDPVELQKVVDKALRNLLKGLRSAGPTSSS